MESNKPRFPPSLNAIKSEYKVFCDRYGGPIICDDRFAKIDFEYCCREIPRQMFEPTINRWTADPVHGIRHWPLMAHAALAVMAAKQATSVIPIVFATAGDPVANHLVASLARPGGNVTGLSVQSNDLAGKRIELLREVVPGLRRLAIMGNVDNPFVALEMGEVQAA